MQSAIYERPINDIGGADVIPEDAQIITLADQLDLSIAGMIQLMKNPVRSILTTVLCAIREKDYKKIYKPHIRKSLNPLGVEVFMSLNRILVFEENALQHYNAISIAMNTHFGAFSFQLDTTELEVAIDSNVGILSRLEETDGGRAIIGYMYDAFSSPSSILKYNEEVANTIKKYLNRI